MLEILLNSFLKQSMMELCGSSLLVSLANNLSWKDPWRKSESYILVEC